MSGVFDRHPWTRWTVPGAAVAGLVAGGLLLPSTASADGLPARTAEQLLTDVQQAQVPGLSGHVTETADLGLPSLPASMTGTDTSLTNLITGTHTARVWTSGADKSRVAIEAQGQETDVVRNGTTAWQWSSATNTVTRMLLPAGSATKHSAGSDLTPQQAAQQILAAVGPSTTVTTAANDVVANRPAYELVLAPKDSSSRIASVKIAIDGQTKVPLRVEVFSTRMSSPALSMGFDSVDFSVPSASVFDFTPPAGAKVTTKDLTRASDTKSTDKPSGDAAPKPTVTGTGWTRIATGHIDLASMSTEQSSGSATSSSPSVTKLLGLLPTVSGSYGTAHVLDGTLVSAVITTDGRYAVGAVAPDKLLTALPGK